MLILKILKFRWRICVDQNNSIDLHDYSIEVVELLRSRVYYEFQDHVDYARILPEQERLIYKKWISFESDHRQRTEFIQNGRWFHTRNTRFRWRWILIFIISRYFKGYWSITGWHRCCVTRIRTCSHGFVFLSKILR